MILIDAGHGGWDPGGGSNTFFKEKDLNKEISDYEYRRFRELGLPVAMVRVADETLTPVERIKNVENLGASINDILISNHINTGGGTGGEVIYSIRGDGELPNMIARSLKAAGLPIRNVYTKVGSTGKDYYFMLRNTAPKNAMIIEYGFADNAADTNRLLYDWPTLAEAVVKAVANYYKVPYTPPTFQIHIVRPDESLYSISKKYNTTVDAIKKENNLQSNTIYPRMVLTIPHG